MSSFIPGNFGTSHYTFMTDDANYSHKSVLHNLDYDTFILVHYNPIPHFMNP